MEMEGTGAGSTPDVLTPAFILELWNASVSLPIRPGRMTDLRERELLDRIKETPNINDWREAIAIIADSEFCNGENERGWVANFRTWFCIRPNAIPNALGGTYDTHYGRQELEQAAAVRSRLGWGRYCQHEPTCEDSTACLTRIARRLRQQRWREGMR